MIIKLPIELDLWTFEAHGLWLHEGHYNGSIRNLVSILIPLIHEPQPQHRPNPNVQASFAGHHLARTLSLISISTSCLSNPICASAQSSASPSPSVCEFAWPHRCPCRSTSIRTYLRNAARTRKTSAVAGALSGEGVPPALGEVVALLEALRFVVPVVFNHSGDVSRSMSGSPSRCIVISISSVP